MSDRQLVFFFTSRSSSGRLAFDVSRALCAAHEWRLLTIENDADRAAFRASAPHRPDLIVSFLNPYVVPEDLIAAAGGRAFNIHPATPEYPGRDPQHFAFYEGAKAVGATLHRMTSQVDSGEVIDVLEECADRRLGVMRYIEQSEHLAVALLISHLPALLDDTIRPAGRWCWREAARRTRKDFLAMCRLNPSLPATEIRRRIDAFFNPAYRTVCIELDGLRFVYEPNSDGRET